MNTSEKEVRIAARLYEVRDSVRIILGDKYPMKMAEVGALVKGYAEHRGKGVLEASAQMAIAENNGGDPMVALLILAAGLEIVEPS